MDFKHYIDFRKFLSIINLNNVHSLDFNEIRNINQNYNILSIDSKEIYSFLKFLDNSSNENNNQIKINQVYLRDIVETLDKYLNPLYINGTLDNKSNKKFLWEMNCFRRFF